MSTIRHIKICEHVLWTKWTWYFPKGQWSKHNELYVGRWRGCHIQENAHLDLGDPGEDPDLAAAMKASVPVKGLVRVARGDGCPTIPSGTLIGAKLVLDGTWYIILASSWIGELVAEFDMDGGSESPLMTFLDSSRSFSLRIKTMVIYKNSVIALFRIWRHYSSLCNHYEEIIKTTILFGRVLISFSGQWFQKYKNASLTAHWHLGVCDLVLNCNKVIFN